MAAVGAVVGVIGAIKQRQAAKDAERQGEANAAMEARTTAEETKRLKKDQAQQQSIARARASASGVSGGSMDAYMSALEQTGAEEVSWLKEVGASKYNQAMAGGRQAYNQAMSGFWGSLGGAASKGYKAWGNR